MPSTIAFVQPELLYAWKGPSLLIVDVRGECSERQSLSGFYYQETRFLRTLRMDIDGEPAWRCEAAMIAPDLLEFTFVYPEQRSPGGGGTGQSQEQEETNARGIPVRAIDVRVLYTVHVNQLVLQCTATNRARRPVTFEIGWSFDADFADIQEALSQQRQQEAPVETENHDDAIELVYRHERLPLHVLILRPVGWRAAGGRMSTTVTLAPQETGEWSIGIIPLGCSEVVPPETPALDAAWQKWRDSFTRVTVPRNRTCEEVFRNNTRDIAAFPLLTGPPDEWLAMQAGMPLYPAFFGRDAVTAGWQAALLDRGQSLDAALTRLGRLQSSRFDDWHDEEPGRIPYQVRTGPLALLDVNPYAAYYADYASPLMFVISLANLYAWSGDRACLRRHWDTARRILDWARELGDADHDGYLEYRTRSSAGTKNQGWKDSGDAVIYADGTPVPAPMATCELQGYWYQAQMLMSGLCFATGARADAAAFRESASALKERFNRDWWMESEQFFALALDPHKRQVGALTSNVGHCLACGIIERDRLGMVVGRLFAPDLFSGWGIRTLSSQHRFYNPLSYHRGSVWAVEQATIMFGLRRFGFDARALDLARALFDLAQLYPGSRIPECIGGFARVERSTPGAYPRANTPQLWNATAFPLAVQTMLGIIPLAPLEMLVVDPVLPTWLPELVLHGLRVGNASVDLRFWRGEDGRARWDVLAKRGTLHVVRQPPPESLSAGLLDRIATALESLPNQRLSLWTQ